MALPLETTPETPVYGIGELSLILKKKIEDRFTNIRLRGEVSNLKLHSSGHHYFSLKDADAVMDAVMWRGSASGQGQGIKLEDGLEIIAQGRLTTYPQRSKYQFIVERFSPTGQGALLKLLEERKQKLAAEGLFATALKKPLPTFPQRIGVITSATGAVIRDILHRLADRYPCSVILWPVAVQGNGSAEQIAAAIEGMNALPPSQIPDVLIVARGGGSLEDLWSFNEEIVVRAARQSHIPLISAVGHETDTTLIDYASDKRAPTPTAAAELATPVLRDVWLYVQSNHNRLQTLLTHIQERAQLKLTSLARGLLDPSRFISDKMLRVDDWGERLKQSMEETLRKKALYLQGLRPRSPQELLTFSKSNLSLWAEKLQQTFQRDWEKRNERFERAALSLEQLSYERILEKGFCFATLAKGTALTKASAVPATPFQLHFKDGAVSVKKVKEDMLKEKLTSPQPSLFGEG